MRTSSQILVVFGLWNHPPRNGWKIFVGLYIIQKRFCRLLEPVPQNTTHRWKHNNFLKTTDAKKHPNEQKHRRKPWCIQTKKHAQQFSRSSLLLWVWNNCFVSSPESQTYRINLRWFFLKVLFIPDLWKKTVTCRPVTFNGRVEKCFGISIPWKSARQHFFLRKNGSFLLDGKTWHILV